MNEIINLKLVAMEEGSSIDLKAVMDALQMLQFKHRISYDYDRMMVLCDVFDSVASQKVWEAAGRRFPLAFYFDSETIGGTAVMQLYDSLTERDRADVDIIPAKTGCRTSLYVRRERADLLARFWDAMFPPTTKKESARLRGGRNRSVEFISAKVPEDLVMSALKKGKARDKIICLDGAVYVTDEILRQIRKDHEVELMRKSGKKKVSNRNYREGR